MFVRSRFLAGSSDSDSDDERRVVKSAKDKSLVDLGACCEDIRVRKAQRKEGGGMQLSQGMRWCKHGSSATGCVCM